jgi:hypothetical protein
MVPATVVEERFAFAEDAAFDLGRSLRVLGVSMAVYAWASVSQAAQFRAALDLVRGQPVRWRAFFTSVVRAPHVFVTTLVVVIPIEAATLSPYPLGSGEATLVLSLASVVMIFLMIRTLPWAPLVIDTRRPLWEGFVASFAWTRGEFFRLLFLVLFVACFAIPVLVVEWVVFGKIWHVSFAAMGGLYALSVAPLYVEMASHAERGARPPVSASPSLGPSDPGSARNPSGPQ